MANINETFTGTNGATPSGWTSTGSGSATIQSNAYRLISPATGTYVTHRASRTGLANGDGTVDILVSTLTEHYPEWLVRSSSATAYGNGYSVTLLPADSLLQILEWSGGTNSVLGTGASFTYVAGTTYRVRFQWNGSTLRAKIWDPNGSEPGSWMVDTTDASTTAAGTIHFTVTSGGTAGARTATFDNLNITDLDAAQTVAPTAIGSAETFGTAAITQTITTTGITSAEVFGSATVAGAQTVAPTGIATAEAFGTAAVSQSLSLTGISSSEAFGAVAIRQSLALTGISSAEAFGLAAIRQSVNLAGIASAETFGSSLAVSAGAIIPPSIASLETFGSLTVTPGAAQITLTGISSGEAFGSTAVKQNVSLTGISTGEAFGSYSVSTPQTISLTGIDTLEQFGSFSLTNGPPTPIDLTGYAIESRESLGVPTVRYGIGWRLLNPTRVDRYRLGDPWHVQYVTNIVGFTVLGSDAGLFVVETPATEDIDSSQYVWLGGHDNITTDIAIRNLWLANNLSVETVYNGS